MTKSARARRARRVRRRGYRPFFLGHPRPHAMARRVLRAEPAPGPRRGVSGVQAQARPWRGRAAATVRLGERRQQAGSLSRRLSARARALRLSTSTPTSSCPCAQARARPMRTASAALGRSCRRSKRSARSGSRPRGSLRDRLSDRGALAAVRPASRAGLHLPRVCRPKAEPKIVAHPAGLAAGWEAQEDVAAHWTARARRAPSGVRADFERESSHRAPDLETPKEGQAATRQRDSLAHALVARRSQRRGDATRRPAARDRPFQVVRFDWALSLPHRRHPRPRAGGTGCSAGSNEERSSSKSSDAPTRPTPSTRCSRTCASTTEYASAAPKSRPAAVPPNLRMGRRVTCARSPRSSASWADTGKASCCRTHPLRRTEARCYWTPALLRSPRNSASRRMSDT